MEPLYKTKTKYSYDEYRKFNYAIVSKINKMPVKVIVIILLFVLLAYFYMKHSIYVMTLLLMTALIFPIIFYISIESNIKKTYESNKSMKDLEVDFEFYDNHCIYKSDNGETKIEYKNLYKLIETKTNFYLMIAKNQGIILIKQNCDEEFQNFLRKLI